MGDMVKNSTQESGNNNGGQEPEKTFTQEDVNRIVGERLARAKQAADGDQIGAREKELQRRELAIQAQEMLIDKGLPKGLADILYYTDKDSLTKAVAELEKHIDLISESSMRGLVPLPGGQLPTGKGVPEVDPMRRAFGLE